jgi:hypothetical protein
MDIIDVNGNSRKCVSAVPDSSFPGFMKIEYKSKNRKGYVHFEWYSINDFIKNNPKHSKLARGAKQLPGEDLGVVSKAGKDFIEDATKNWPKNIFIGTPVWVSRGKGEGQLRKVIKNDKNKLFTDKPWKVIPDKSSQYVVSHNVNKDIKAVGNNLPGIETRAVVEKLINKAKKSLIN